MDTQKDYHAFCAFSRNEATKHALKTQETIKRIVAIKLQRQTDVLGRKHGLHCTKYVNKLDNIKPTNNT